MVIPCLDGSFGFIEIMAVGWYTLEVGFLFTESGF